MARARGANAVMAGAFETTYGTAPLSGFKKLPFVSAALGDEQGLIASDLLGYGREPLPPSHALWKMDNVVVTPHISGPSTPDEIAPVFNDNLARYLAGRPLRYVVDRSQGY